MPWLVLLRRFWWTIPMAVLWAVGVTYKVRLDHATARVTSLEAQIHDSEIVARSQLAAAQRRTEEINARYQETRQQVDDLSRRLRDGLLRYQAAFAARSASPATAPGATIPSGGNAASAPTRGEIDVLVADTVAACTRDAARFAALQDWARTVATEQPQL